MSLPSSASTGVLKHASRIPRVAAVIVPSLWAAIEIKDTFNGQKPMIEQKVSDNITEKEYETMQHSWANNSGHPLYDNAVLQYIHGAMVGPGGILMTWNRVKNYATGIWKEVIWRNIVPISIAVAGLYTGLGKHSTGPYKGQYILHTPFKAAFKELKPIIGPVLAKHSFTDFVKSGATKYGPALLRKLANGAKFLGENARYTLPVLGIGAFAVYRFSRVKNHEEQHALFQPITEMEQNDKVV